MDKTYDVSDPSDWLETAAPTLAPVEAALRCRVCKDFFTTPVITSCSHTFCSLCIRRCLTHDGQCPACRAKDQEVRLRPNWLVQELVEAFQAARPGTLQSVREVVRLRTETQASKHKRKHEITDTESEGQTSRSSPHKRKTRSQDAKQMDREVGNAVSEDASSGVDTIACPICKEKMREEDVFSHLDIHNTSDEKDHQNEHGASGLLASPKAKPPRAKLGLMERLSQMNYSMMTDKDLRKKLANLGIPSSGPKAVLIRRHMEWVNLVNANCDETKSPRSKHQLLKDLDTWEKAQGRQIQGHASSIVMDKEFDGAAWASKHGEDFQRLIADARRKASASQEIAASATADSPTPDHGLK